MGQLDIPIPGDRPDPITTRLELAFAAAMLDSRTALGRVPESQLREYRDNYHRTVNRFAAAYEFGDTDTQEGVERRVQLASAVGGLMRLGRDVTTESDFPTPEQILVETRERIPQILAVTGAQLAEFINAVNSAPSHPGTM